MSEQLDTRVEFRDSQVSDSRGDDDLLPAGTHVGRYMLVEAIGEGGIGIVYSAYDPDLDRKVAIKLLRPSKLLGDDAAADQRRARMRREAQALARLSHPNVVPVYEVLSHGEQTCVVMEFVEGANLREWLHAERRSWTEILAVFVQAGRGLAAAHDADIVHRDFKPDNVRVGSDGRVRVLDFGLAGLSPDGSEPEPWMPPVDSSELEPEDAVTREGQVMGTPAYMAPEQAAAGEVDARSDQFSFCVALYEAIYGVRPFRGRYDNPARYRNLSRDRKLPGTRPSDLPQEIEDLLVRGLSLDPDQRFPDMRALLAAIAGVARGSRWLLWMPVVTIVFAFAALLAFSQRSPEMPELCRDSDALLAGVWDETLAEELGAAVASSARPYAADTWATVQSSLDDWSARWRKARLRACESTHVHKDQSPQLLERRIACLDRQLVRLESMIGGLRRLEERPDTLLERLSSMLGRLPTPESCTAANLLENDLHLPSDPERASEAELIRAQLAEVQGASDIGEYERATALGEDARTRARLLDFAPLTAEALYGLGYAVDRRASEPERAETLLSEAVWTAMRAGDQATLVRAAAQLVGQVGTQQARLDQARLWAQLAQAAFARYGGDPELEISLRTNLGDLAMAEGDYERGLVEHERALELAGELAGEIHLESLRSLRSIGDAQRELGRFDEAAASLERAHALAADVLGAKHPDIAAIIDAIANVRASQGHFDEALGLHRQALGINEEIFGPEHRTVARNLNNLAIIFDETGRYAESVDTLDRARSILVKAAGAEHPDVAFVDVNLGSALHNLNRDEEAILRYEQALAVLESSLGPDHMSVGVTLQNLGAARAALGKHEAALSDYERAGEVLEAAFGKEHPAIAALDHNRAGSLRELGRLDEALLVERRALETRESIYGSEHAELLEILSSLAITQLALGRPEPARELAERAIALASEETNPLELADAQLALAKALVADPSATPEDRARARELGQRARAGLGAAEGATQEREELEQWLSEAGLDE